MCSAPAFCPWRRLPICLKLLFGVCVRVGLAASVCVCRTSAASVEFLPRGWRAVALHRWLMFKYARRGSFSHCSLLASAFVICVYETGLPLLFAHVPCRTCAASVEFLHWGWRAVVFPRWLHVLSCSTWLIVRCCIGGLFFGFIDASTAPSTKLRLLVVEALLMLLSQGLLLLCHLDNALRLSSYIQ